MDADPEFPGWFFRARLFQGAVSATPDLGSVNLICLAAFCLLAFLEKVTEFPLILTDAFELGAEFFALCSVFALVFQRIKGFELLKIVLRGSVYFFHEFLQAVGWSVFG
jgi:hypothetical protein